MSPQTIVTRAVGRGAAFAATAALLLSCGGGPPPQVQRPALPVERGATATPTTAATQISSQRTPASTPSPTSTSAPTPTAAPTRTHPPTPSPTPRGPLAGCQEAINLGQSAYTLGGLAVVGWESYGHPITTEVRNAFSKMRQDFLDTARRDCPPTGASSSSGRGQCEAALRSIGFALDSAYIMVEGIWQGLVPNVSVAAQAGRYAAQAETHKQGCR